MWLKLSLFSALLFNDIISVTINDLNLPPQHIKYVLYNYEELRNCAEDPLCIDKGLVGPQACWGYEERCNASASYEVRPRCPGDHRGWVKTKQAQYDTFYTQADFGYVKEQMQELMVMCEASYPDDTSLECSKYLRFCRGRNMMLNFTGLIGRGDNLRYKMDILGPGQIGGHCNFHHKRLMEEAEHMSALQSWAPELVNFVDTSQRPIADGLCDVVISKPTYIMKIDATVNMYHHFCDFFNLYASLHVNSTHPSTFSRDNHILVWETFTYDSLFKDAFKAFTVNPIWDLKTFRGKTVCFKNLVLPLLPRMIFGLYYNTPLIYGCEKSGLFHAFSKHMLHSLDVKLQPRKDDRVRVTLLSRGTTYRGILNEKELLDELTKIKGLDVQRVVYDKNVPFLKQLEITYNSDVFIGMHGAGLTHLLFLPDWAAVFEVYNCEDPNCYKDLSRLRGLKYVTWENQDKLVQQDQVSKPCKHEKVPYYQGLVTMMLPSPNFKPVDVFESMIPDWKAGVTRTERSQLLKPGHGPGGTSHAKFTNYSFDVKEFVRLVEKCAEHVRKQKEFQEFVKTSTAEHEEL